MRRSRWKWPVFWTVAALLCTAPWAEAHMTSMGRLFVQVRAKKQVVELVLSISRDDVGTFLKHDTDNNRRIDDIELKTLRDPVRRYFSSRLKVSNQGQLCAVAQQRFLLEREKKSRRRLVWAMQFKCDKALGRVLIENTVMFDDVGGYSHLSRIQVGDAVYAPYFSRLSPRYLVEIQKPKAQSPKAAKATVQSKGEGWLQTLTRFLFKGVWHIIIGIDHIAFVLCLLLVARSMKGLIWVITSFTLGHSITLILCVMDIVFLPVKPTEALIALTIAYVGVENILFRHNPDGPRFRYVITCIFGLIHGFGFSYTLRELQLPKGALVPSLLGFNLGIELGQIAIVALIYPTLHAQMQKDSYERFLVGASGLITAVAMYWFVMRAFF